jgi:hypothetical protein
VERAVNRGLPIIPFRIENVMPARSLEYFLSTPHWLDAFTPPLEQHLSYLADVIRHILDGAPAPTQPKLAQWKDRRLLIAGAAALVVVVAAVWFLFPSGPPSFVGKWSADHVAFNVVKDAPVGNALTALAQTAMDGPQTHGTLEINSLSQYRYATWAEDHGTVKVSGKTIVLTSDISHAPLALNMESVDPEKMGTKIEYLGGRPGDSAITIGSAAARTMENFLVGRSTTNAPTDLKGIAGQWHIGGAGAPGSQYSAGVNGVMGPARLDLAVTPDGHYRVRFSMDEAGIWQTTDGKWIRTPQLGPPISGNYRFDGHDKVTLADTMGSTVWLRAN